MFSDSVPKRQRGLRLAGLRDVMGQQFRLLVAI
jgi:hypothetical protein